MSRTLSLWSTLALLPATIGLVAGRSAMSLIYAASFVTTLLYHASFEREWRRLDHALAYGVIAANTWMVWHARRPTFAALGVVFVVAALCAYFDAGWNPERYDVSHAIWHVLSGIAGACFVFGYT